MTQHERKPASAYAVEHPGSLVDSIVEKLTLAIMDRHFPAGERLVETRVAALLGVSRSPLREAFARLEAEGLVESRHGRGTFVVLPTHADFMRMVPVRAVLEGQAARLLAGRGAAADRAALAACNAALKAAAPRGRHAYAEAGWQFHRTMVELADNRFLLGAWQSVSVLVRHFMHSYDVYQQDIELGLLIHDRFLGLIGSGDPDRAERIVRAVVTHHGFAMVGAPVPPALSGYVTGVRPDAALEGEP